MPSVSKKQQRFFGIIRAIKKGVFKGKKTPEIQRAASSISDKDSKKMASTKHKGLPEKVKEELNTDDKPFVKKLVGKLRKGSKTHAKQADDLEKAMNEDYVKELEDGLVKMDYPSYDEVDKLMCKIAKDNDIDTTTLHMAFKTKHLMVPDDWAKKKMMEPVMIPKTPKITGDVKEGVTAKQRFKRDAGAIAKKKIKQKEHNKYVNFLDVDEAVNAAQQAAIAISKRERLQDLKVAKKRKLKKEDYEPVISEKCWKGYEKKGMKTMFGKKYPNCVKKKRTRKEEYEPVNEISGELANKAFMAANKKYQHADNNETKEKAYKQQKKFSNYASEKYQKLNKDRGDLNKIYNKPDAKRTNESVETINELSQDTLNQAARQAMSKREAARGTPEFNKRQKQVEKFTNAASKKRKEIISKKDTLQKSFDKPDAKRTPTMEGNLYEYDGNYHMNKIAKEKGLDLTDPRQRRRANSLARKNAAKGNVNNPAGFSKRKKRTKMQTEGNLHQWFKGSKSKDGKGGWVNVVTGGTCASDKPGEGTPKCVSSSKRASMTKAERLSAQRRKKKADPNQQSKTGAAKPTYVKTDSPRKKKKVSEENINELKTRTMLNYIDKASDSASKQLDKANKTTSRKKEVKARLKMDSRERGIEMAKDKIMRRVKEETISEAGARVGRKFSMGKVGKQYGRDEYGDPINKDGSSPLKKNVDKNPKDDKTPNTLMGEAKSPAWQRKAGKSESGGLNAKGVASYRAANPGSKLKTAVTTKPSKLKKGSKSAKRRLSFCRRMRGMKKKLTSAKTARDPDSRINKSLRKWNCSFEPETGEMIMERGPQVLGSGARQKSPHAKTGKKGTKKVSGMIKSLKRKGSILKQPLGGPADAAAKARRLSYVKDDVDLTILRFIDEGHMNKTCGKGEYYCYQSKKCKDIPKGMKIGYGGMLKPIENEKDESNGKKGGSNGNGNGHGGNGNGHGGNGNGGNGGGNGGGE